MDYKVLIERGLLNNVGVALRDVYAGKSVFLVTDDVVGPLYESGIRDSLSAEGFEVHSFVIPAGEPSKSSAVLADIYDFLIDNGASRKDMLIALGGGVVGDMSGFAAATFMRGMLLAHIPTSLLAQIDSSIGGKVAINVPKGKNLVGAFFNPKVVIIDPDCLKTLDVRFLRDGASEALKYGCIRDKELFESFQSMSSIDDIHAHLDDIISRCCNIKLDVVARDEFESGERMILNFGHTLGHAVESYYNYSRYTHGEAVAIGMAFIAEVSEAHGYAKAGTADSIKAVLKSLGLPFELDDSNVNIKSELVDLVAHDKKNNKEFSNLVLIRDIGDVFIQKLRTDEVRGFFEKGGFC